VSRTRLFLHALPLVTLLSACSGGQQSSLPPDPGNQIQSLPVDPNSPQAASAADPGSAQSQSVVDAQSQPPASADTTSASSATTESGAASAVPETLAAVPAHITTWAYDEYWSLGARGTASQVRTYLSYAQGGLGNSKAVNDCSGSGGACKSVFYFDPHMFYDTAICGNMSPDAKGIYENAKENWFVHLHGYTDSSHRVHGSYRQSCKGTTYTIPVYAMDTLNAGVRSYFANYLHTYARGFNEFFLDDTSGKVTSQFYGAGGGFCGGICTTTQELPVDSYVVAEHGALATALTLPSGAPMYGVFNGVNFTNGRANDLSILTSSAHFHGAVCEGCVISGGKPRPAMFAPVLNAMAQVSALSNAQFIELNDGALAGNLGALSAARKLTTAMAWLGYSNGHTAVWPNLEQYTQNLAIFPENSIYPSSPLQTMRASVGASDIEVAPNVYRREFGACYYNRSAIGACAAIVNGSGGAVVVRSTWLHRTYTHSVQLIGGDIPNGGRISLTGSSFSPNRTYVGAGQALMIVR
jgi:hypothetical protein